MSSSSLPSKGSKILVTGASGFIGIWTCKAFLDAGFKVIGTVRSESKGEYIKKQFSGQPFDYAIVKDIGAPGAFDACLQEAGIEGVAHTASPFHLEAKEPNELIEPAVKGTVGVLESITKYAKDVRRVVVTSSVAAVLEPAEPPKTFDESNFNKFSIAEVEKKGGEAGPFHLYRASKALAEEAAWKYSKEHDLPLVTVNPCLVYGPIIHECAEPSSLNTSVAGFYKFTQPPAPEASSLTTSAGNWVDVREVAEAHVLALTKEQAAGERYIVSAGPFANGQFTEWLRSSSGNEKLKSSLPPVDKTALEEAIGPNKAIVSSGAKAEKELGLKYRSFDECTKDMYDSLQARFA